MNTETVTTPEMAVEIDRLRLNFPDTQDLYHEVCVLLFFRHGITPTANKLYQLVRKGSMSAPTEALRAFWAELREKSRVRIEQPDLPEALKIAAGEMVSALWNEARAAAEQQLESLHQDAAESIRIAKDAQQNAERQTQSVEQELDQERQNLQTSETRVLQLEKALSGQQASNDALKHQLASAEQQRRALEISLDDARQQFASELEKQRDALKRSEERLEGTEKRALLEIDRERQLACRVQQELRQLRQTFQETLERHTVETAGQQKTTAELRERLGVADGLLQAQKERQAEIVAQLNALREQLGTCSSQVALLEQELALRNQRINALEAEIAAKTEQSIQVKLRSQRKRTPTFKPG
ncbi:DNA-binding protein [uncultured Propionivibrio sp.]|uniref:DNA-binding protein n=1 Tax=uncultured Propionivibrio sp. TaxID=426737 RepID=UPI0029C0393C|nr:DNA-binding protein [uncultured Propionivibrio sp.]